MANPYTLDGSEPPPPILPDGGEYALVVMRYKDTELGFAMKPERMGDELAPTMEALRKAVFEQTKGD